MKFQNRIEFPTGFLGSSDTTAPATKSKSFDPKKNSSAAQEVKLNPLTPPVKDYEHPERTRLYHLRRRVRALSLVHVDDTPFYRIQSDKRFNTHQTQSKGRILDESCTIDELYARGCSQLEEGARLWLGTQFPLESRRGVLFEVFKLGKQQRYVPEALELDALITSKEKPDIIVEIKATGRSNTARLGRRQIDQRAEIFSGLYPQIRGLLFYINTNQQRVGSEPQLLTTDGNIDTTALEHTYTTNPLATLVLSLPEAISLFKKIGFSLKTSYHGVLMSRWENSSSNQF